MKRTIYLCDWCKKESPVQNVRHPYDDGGDDEICDACRILVIDAFEETKKACKAGGA